MKAKELIGRTVTVRVNEDHIKLGKPNEARACAVALAVRELIDEDLIISVSGLDVTVRRGLYPICYARISRRLNRFIKQFDDDGERKPAPITARLTFVSGGPF